MNHRIRILVVCAFAAVAVAAQAQNLVVNGSFEQTSPVVAPNNFNNGLSPTTGVPGWTSSAVSANFFEIWGNTVSGILASSGANQLEINAQSVDQTVSQVVMNLTPGCPVTFCFDYTGRNAAAGTPLTPNNDFSVTLSGGFSMGPVSLNPPAYTAAVGWQRFCTNFIPTASTITVTFRGHPHVAVASGAHIDNVSLTSGLPPVIVCPADITTTTSGGSAVVNFANPAVTGGTLESCVPASGSGFALGTTLVTCTARNACGVSTCTFNVTVVADDPGTAPCDRTNKGTDFWLAFPGNYAPTPAAPPEVTLCIAGPAGTTGLVTIPGLPVPASTFTIPAPVAGAAGSITVTLPSIADLGDVSDQVVAKGVHLTASAEVAVFGMNYVEFTADSFLALPKPAWGNEYIVLGYQNVQPTVTSLNGSQFAVVAGDNDTLVTITPSVTTGLRASGVPYVITLQAGEAYQLRNTNAAPADLSGTIIEANKPVAVFAGHRCANVQTSTTFFCNTLVEQLLPVTLWGTEFATVPLATRDSYTVRVVASQDTTLVQTNGIPAVTLNRGQRFEWVDAAPALIIANNPVFVAQYSPSSDVDDNPNADPFMVTILPVTLFGTNDMLCVPMTGFPDNYFNVVVSGTSVASLSDVQLDGSQVIGSPALLATYTIGGNLFGMQVKATPGAHTLSSSSPFGAIAYGYDEFNAYAHPVGMGPGCSEELPNVCLLGIEWMSGGSLLHDISALTGVASNPRNTGLQFPIGLEVAANGDLLAITSQGTANHLVKIDRATGASMPVAQITVPPQLTEGDMAISPPGGAFPGAIYYTEVNNLFRMNAGGGGQTFIGAVPAGIQVRKLSGIAFNSAGRLFAIDTSGNTSHVFEVAPATAAIIGPVSTVGVPLGRIAGFDFDPGSNTFYVVDSFAAGENRLFAINVANGVVTPKPNPTGTATGFSGLAVAPCECLTIMCPSNMVVQSTVANGQHVNFRAVAANSCGGAALVTCDPESGSLFPFGTTVVNCVASDTAGNTVSCSFAVTVLAPPVVITSSSATDTITLVWSLGGTLQVTDDLISPFTNIANATSPYVVRLAEPGAVRQRFYRVMYVGPAP